MTKKEADRIAELEKKIDELLARPVVQPRPYFVPYYPYVPAPAPTYPTYPTYPYYWYSTTGTNDVTGGGTVSYSI